MTAEPPVVETSALEAVFRTGDGVGPVDLVLRAGERVLLLGPSGSGKSTLLRLLHGAVPQAIRAEVTGTVRVAGRDVGEAGIAGLADVAGVVAQDPESGVCLTRVAEEVAFPLENLATDPAAIGPAVDLALRRAGAWPLRDRDTSELSGGELQRVAVAAAIAAGPRLLLLDEPTAMLDADGIAAVRRSVDAACEATGAACVLVEHRLDEFAGDEGVAGLPPRWLVLGPDGRVRHDGPARDLSPAAVRDLIRLGCWLPLDLELAALLDTTGGVSAALRSLLPGAPGTPDGRTSPSADENGSAQGDRIRPPAASDGRSALRASGISVSRGGRVVLRELDVDLRAGETVALVGANGSGKSTLLACLAGLVRPDAGRVTGPRAGLVFQNPEHQFVAATVRAEVAHGRPPGDVDAMLRRFRLADLAGHNPYRLSGGQQRRLSLAAMLVHDRPFLLADEPGLGLDRPAATAAMRALREAAAEGRGVLFSSHDLRAVAAHADRVLVLGDGGLLADTTPLGLLRRPDLLAAARLHPPRLLRLLAGTPAGAAPGVAVTAPGGAGGGGVVGDDGQLRAVLDRLDDLAGLPG